MNLFNATLPFSYLAIVAIFLAGISFTFLLFGIVASCLIIICIYCGIIRISPILDGIVNLFSYAYPGFTESVKQNLRDSFVLEYPEGKPRNGNFLFGFHPHGLFSVANIFHIGTDLTTWSIRPIQATVLDKLYLLPFSKEILDRVSATPSNYNSMKAVLTKGESLTVCLGGTREILYTEKNVMKLSILNKKGIFRLAIETGTPLIPVISYGENELFEIVKHPWLTSIQTILLEYGICIPLPTLQSCKTWFNILQKPMKNPIRTVVGKVIEVGVARVASDKDISELRDQYFTALRHLYSTTRPEAYSKDLEII